MKVLRTFTIAFHRYGLPSGLSGPADATGVIPSRGTAFLKEESAQKVPILTAHPQSGEGSENLHEGSQNLHFPDL